MATTTLDSPRAALPAVPTDLLIGREWRPAEGGRTLAVVDPATGGMNTRRAASGR